MVCQPSERHQPYHRHWRPFWYLVAMTWVIFLSDSISLAGLLVSSVLPQLFFFCIGCACPLHYPPPTSPPSNSYLVCVCFLFSEFKQ